MIDQVHVGLLNTRATELKILQIFHRTLLGEQISGCAPMEKKNIYIL